MDINDETKKIVQELGSAINAAVEKSSEVAEAIDRLRNEGFELELTLKMEIGLRPVSDDDSAESETSTLDLTADDLRTLRQMKIRIDDN
ncbi:MAG: hypothetical protein QOH96_3717 [Blastocatellia bacterium]|nr:hypothetical protein [Blastocatellia bacterium]